MVFWDLKKWKRWTIGIKTGVPVFFWDPRKWNRWYVMTINRVRA